MTKPAVFRNGLLYKLFLATALLLVAIPHSDAQLTEEPQITALMNRWIAYNLENQEIRGWRIQIMASIDRRQMESARRVFEKRYPEYPVIFIHNEPFLKKMQQDYPQAIPVTDNLKVEELLLYDQ